MRTLATLSQRLAERPADTIVQAIRREYGEDRTFAVPILMNCGLAGLVAWDDIPGLPFELAVLPHGWYKALRLHVVSYALPALIAIGLLIDRRNPPASIVRRLIRKMVTPRVLEKLRHIQPDHGGFLEATPLTSFVAMAMLPLFGRDQPVAAKCLRFLRQSQRSDGAWPIDTNLSVWLTTAAVAALAAAASCLESIAVKPRGGLPPRQYRVRHPYTNAEPGGWAWTHLAGGVPDVDDTSGAILALRRWDSDDGIAAGVRWLLELQNADGGWPTFCRGWGKLPFDQSAPDLTAHALRAICLRQTVRGRAGVRSVRDSPRTPVSLPVASRPTAPGCRCGSATRRLAGQDQPGPWHVARVAGAGDPGSRRPAGRPRRGILASIAECRRRLGRRRRPWRRPWKKRPWPWRP